MQQAPMICQVCGDGFFVGTLGTCLLMNQINQTTCNIQNCAYCTNANSTCQACMPGFQLTSQNTCTNNTCNIEGCANCGNNGLCSGCILGYNFVAATNTCQKIGYGCSDPNCQICIGPQSCGQCIPGYTIKQFYTTGGNSVMLCRPLPCPISIQNCAKCSYQYTSLFNFQQVLCAQCNPNYILVNGYCVAQLTTYNCSVANCASCSFNNFCSQCNNGYVLSALGICIPTQCNNVANCASCSANYICQQCNTGYSLSLGFLSFQFQPISTTVINMLTSQCVLNKISCNIANCAYCNSNNVCASCAMGYDFPSGGSNSCIPACNVNNCYQCI